MGGAHSLENRSTLGSQDVGMATPHRLTQHLSTTNVEDAPRWTDDIKRAAESSWILERPTKDLCLAVDVNRLK
ncbi:jg13265 [Pararge aegeria aegeria]|uniref:Jg13265 protein n=1 Tax=Pararge aegeria aegeria TaxID=348720 RepID=A0A8S4RI70_9NEOP|nr:jg13265 [Pararge aegeria aegeria]